MAGGSEVSDSQFAMRNAMLGLFACEQEPWVGEKNSVWLWDSPVLVPVTPPWLLVCAREEAGAPRGSCCA